VVEEAPSAIVTAEIRKKMGEAAVNVAKSCDYLGAGTVEFLMDADKNFYFLEMNTRLQVEHPVTEWITGTDLVAEQIRIAEGKPISFKQDDLQIKGHAIELRVYAEDSFNDFAPSIGFLSTYQPPKGKNIRVDDGFKEGMEVPIYYDPMLSKLITYGSSRIEAIEKMIKAIDNYHVEGVETTLPFGKYVCQHEAFRSGRFDTHFVKNYFSEKDREAFYEDEANIAAKAALHTYLKQKNSLSLPNKVALPAVKVVFNK
jgi:propionyl-CoA carboxylase alpha chain